MPINKELLAIIESKDSEKSIINQLQKLIDSNPEINLNETFTDEARKGHTLFSWLIVNNKISIAHVLFNLGAATNIHPIEINLIKILNELVHKADDSEGTKDHVQKAILQLRDDILLAENKPNVLATDPVFKPFLSTELMASLVLESYGVMKSMVANYVDTIDPNIKDIQGKTVLCLAAKMNRDDIVAYLLKMLPGKIDLNTQDNEGNTPLHYAFAYGNKDMITTLLAKGAKYNIRNKHRMKPEQMLFITRNSIVKLLASVSINANRDANVTSNTPCNMRIPKFYHSKWKNIYLPGYGQI